MEGDHTHYSFYGSQSAVPTAGNNRRSSLPASAGPSPACASNIAPLQSANISWSPASPGQGTPFALHSYGSGQHVSSAGVSFPCTGGRHASYGQHFVENRGTSQMNLHGSTTYQVPQSVSHEDLYRSPRLIPPTNSWANCQISVDENMGPRPTRYVLYNGQYDVPSASTPEISSGVGTPFQDQSQVQYRNSNQMSYQNPSGNLIVPSSQANQHRPPSASSSPGSVTSSCSDPVFCNNCGKPFNGDYRKGNLARHKRQKHGEEEQVYPCEADGCDQSFKRQDARLKHYRKHHPWLAPNPPLSRK